MKRSNYVDAVNRQKVKERRRFILMLLADSPDYVASDATIRGVFNETDFQISQVEGDLHWLKEAQLISLKEVDGLLFARLLPMGLDVVNHRRVVPGVSSRDIGEWEDV